MTSPVETNLQAILYRVDRQAFTQLFTEDLAWNRPKHPPITVTLDDTDLAVRQVANYRGLGVWHCPRIPTRDGQRLVDKEVARRNTERLIIFTEPDRQEWRWPRYANHRGIGNPRLVNHPHVIGQPNPNLVERLTRITIDPTAGTTLPELLQRMRDAFDAEAEKASVAAARLMGALYEQLAAAGITDSDASVILARILFLMFGDDTGMWRANASTLPIPNLFHDYLTDHTDPDGSDLSQRLHDVFTVVDTPIDDRPVGTNPHLNRLPYVNGGIFHDPVAIPSALPATLRAALIEACKFDWGQISPAVFGSMFQEVKSPEERRALGEHYTTEQNILKTIDPLFMDELRDKLAAAWDSKAQLTKLHNSLKDLRFLDPACGCGNFLVVAYRELRALELELLKRRMELNELDGRHSGTVPQQLAMDASEWLNVTIDQFHGIEIEPWPARIAETAMFLVDHQANQRMEQDLGQAPDRLPISLTAHITIGNALRLDWTELVPPAAGTYVFGNPPFNGARTLTREGRADMEHVWGSQLNHNFDFVTCWYRKALDYFAGTAGGRWAYVSTNSVCQGEPAADLWAPILDGNWRTRFAHRSFQWTSEAAGAAAVHVSIVGFDRGFDTPQPFLWTYPAGGRGHPVGTATSSINPYLSEGPPILVHGRRQPLQPLLPEPTFGHRAIDDGNLLVSADEYSEVEADPVAARYLRRFVGARELMHDSPRWCLWLVDMDPVDLERSSVLSARVADVAEFRAMSKNPATKAAAATPHLFGIMDSSQLANAGDYLAIPNHVSESRDYFTPAYFSPDVICGNANFTVPDPDGFALGVLSSTMFIAWMKAIGGRIKSDIRFSKTFTYNTFPLPAVAPTARSNLEGAAAGILAARASFPGKSLSDLYAAGAMPADLRAAHDAIDLVVDEVFGLKANVGPTERRAALFEAYAALAQG